MSSQSETDWSRLHDKIYSLIHDKGQVSYVLIVTSLGLPSTASESLKRYIIGTFGSITKFAQAYRDERAEKYISEQEEVRVAHCRELMAQSIALTIQVKMLRAYIGDEVYDDIINKSQEAANEIVATMEESSE